MRKRHLIAATVLVVAAWGPVTAVQAAGVGVGVASPRGTVESGPRPVCGPVPRGYVRCFAEVISAATAIRYSPAQIKSAYRLPTGSTAGAGQTVAIVSAFDAPTIEHDLGVFSTRFHLRTCTTANGCFSKLDQNGGTSYPPADGFWATETSIDVEWVHAIAPGANIVLVEATDNKFGNMLGALDTAKTKGKYVSNSWGTSEQSVETNLDHHFTDLSGISFFFATGDSGAPAVYPATSPDVVAVGGTSLHVGRKITETGWSGSGGGCSPYESASSAQAAFTGYSQVQCAGNRAAPDVSMVADPATGAAIYDSTPDPNNRIGWFTVGGTSLATPIVAGRAAVTGVVVDQTYIYGRAASLFRDITSGNNGHPAMVGFDLVTGRGSWLH